MTENPFEAMQDQFNRLSQENEELQESISELVARANEAFWQPIGFASGGR